MEAPVLPAAVLKASDVPEKPPDAGWPLALALLEGIEYHAVSGEHIDSGRYQESVRNLRMALAPGVSGDEADRVGREACAVMEEYGRSTREWNRRQAGEIQNMVSMLNQTVVVLSSGSQRSITRLQRVEKQLERASQIEDLVAMKAHFAECLAYVREESARERDEVARTVLMMEQQVKDARDEMAVERSGVPGRAEAEQAIAAAILEAPERNWVVVLELDRYRAVQARFGAAAAEHLLSHFGGELGRRLPSPKRLFRWNPGSVVVLIESGKRHAELEQQVRDALRTLPLETNLELGSRVAVLTQSHQWQVVWLADFTAQGTMAGEIDRLLGAGRRPDAL